MENVIKLLETQKTIIWQIYSDYDNLNDSIMIMAVSMTADEQSQLNITHIQRNA